MSVKAFSEFLDSNPDIASKVAASSTFDQVASIAKENGFEISGAELTKYAAQATSELSDEALDAVAGGAWTGEPSGDATLVTGGIGGAAAITSAIIVK